jgi:UDP-N-acetylmuramate dehydrogenase
MRVGGAVISKQHANFIINDKEATTADVRALIGLARNAVYAQYGIRLEEEIRYL